MPHISEIRQSKYLQKSDCTPDILVTITNCTQENVAMEGKPPELKWCLHFKEQAKPMVLNSVNAQLIAGIIGNEDTDNWYGHQVVLYNDPSIAMQGKLVGGIRARKPQFKNRPAQTARPAPAPLPDRAEHPGDPRPMGQVLEPLTGALGRREDENTAGPDEDRPF